MPRGGGYRRILHDSVRIFGAAESMIDISDTRAIALFLDKLAAEQGAAANTILAYGRDLGTASAELSGRLARATADDLRALFAKWTSLSPASLSRRRSSLRRFFAFLQSEGLRSDHPAMAIAGVKRGDLLPKTLSGPEVGCMFETLDGMLAETPTPRVVRLKALFELLYGSGLRASELVSLPRNAIRPPQPFAIILGKGNKERMVPLSAPALAAVAAHLALVPRESPFLFPSGKQHLTRMRLYQLVKALAAKAGISPERVSPHVLRHAFATHMLQNGADLRSLQMLLGHSDISTTERYTHVETQRLVETVQTLHPLADD